MKTHHSATKVKRAASLTTIGRDRFGKIIGGGGAVARGAETRR
jgi:hypothetical protein